MKVALVIPTYNAGKEFEQTLDLINKQNELLDSMKIIDSSSSDNTVLIAKKNHFAIEIISKDEFSHGGTRRGIAIEFYNKGFDYLIFMTQDVFLQENALSEIVSFISSDSNIGVAYGKQEVDLKRGNLFEFYARNFNYPDESFTRTEKDIPKYGIKTIFTSDAFSIYNLDLLKRVDFFPNSTDVSEDMLVAHKFIKEGYSVGYCADAKVYHTHNYNIYDEFRRYKEIGKFYKHNDTMLKKYGKTSTNGIKLAIGEIAFLISEKKWTLVPISIIRNGAKFLGLKVGFYLNE